MRRTKTKGIAPKPVLSGAIGARIRMLVKVYYEIQEPRKAFANSVRNLAKVYKRAETKEHQALYEQLYGLEQAFKKQMLKEVQAVNIWAWLAKVQGIGPTIAAGLISSIQDPKRFDTVAKLWQYGGLSVEEECTKCKKLYKQEPDAYVAYATDRYKEFKKKTTKKERQQKAKTVKSHLCACEKPEIKVVAQRRRAGLPVNYNPFLKNLAWKISEQFVKVKNRDDGYYGKKYDEYKKAYLKAAKITQGHTHARAKRKAVKLFMSHLWTVWRLMNGLKTRKLYVQTVLKHENIIDPPYMAELGLQDDKDGKV